MFIWNVTIMEKHSNDAQCLTPKRQNKAKASKEDRVAPHLIIYYSMNKSSRFGSFFISLQFLLTHSTRFREKTCLKLHQNVVCLLFFTHMTINWLNKQMTEFLFGSEWYHRNRLWNENEMGNGQPFLISYFLFLITYNVLWI